MNNRITRLQQRAPTPVQNKSFVSAGYENNFSGVDQRNNVQRIGNQIYSGVQTQNQTAATLNTNVTPTLKAIFDNNMQNEEQPLNEEDSDGSQKRKWFRGNKKKTSVREKRIRQNRNLRKLLTPKNALMALNEINGNKVSDYKVLPEDKGFMVEVLVNNVRYEGRGPSKICAKNNASEKALRDLIIQKMVLKPKITKNDVKVSESEDVEMKDDDNSNDVGEVPMMHLASFALHKLFTEWQADGFEIPDFKNLGAESAEVPKKPLVGKTEVPANAQSLHPSMLLAMMRPATQYVTLGSEGTVPNIMHKIGVTVDGQQFVASARNKKIARKHAAIAACNALFGTTFVPDDVNA